MVWKANHFPTEQKDVSGMVLANCFLTALGGTTHQFRVIAEAPFYLDFRAVDWVDLSLQRWLE